MRIGLSLTLLELATHIAAELRGDPCLRVQQAASLQQAMPGALTFLSHKKYRRYLAQTRATAVVINATDAAHCPVAALVHPEPYVAFAQAVRALYPATIPVATIHPSAVIATSAVIHATAAIGPLAVIDAGVEIGPRVQIGPACIVQAQCRIGADANLVAKVTLCTGTIVGERTVIQPGAVIGADGFGFAKIPLGWLRIPQLGNVIIGNDVEIGANTTIDRGSLDDTCIANGAILDNLIQIGHNVHIGERTAVVACSGISGSTKIGRDCLLGGNVGIAGHLEIGDGVCLAAGSRVTHSILNAGHYGGVIPVEKDPLWRRNVTRIRHLDELVRRVRQLERQFENNSQNQLNEKSNDEAIF